MQKLFVSLAAAVVAIAAAGQALPAAAASVSNCVDEKVLGADGLYHEKVAIFADSIAMELRQQGYDVQSVQPWGGCVGAFVTDPGGGSHMEFFDPDTLEPLSTN